ncbi:MAG: esterase/lipase family protein [Planctomycetota bacterium]
MTDSIQDDRDLIILVHGFGANRVFMWPLASRLRSLFGFRVRYWNYRSLFAPIETHADRFFGFLATQLSREQRFHVVAHSMGAIVTRAALNRSHLPNLGRLVLLTPPNGGSPTARRASKVLGGIFTPMREMSDRPSSYVNLLHTDSDIEVGIIAARFDILVPARNTHLPSERRHQTLNATHNSVLLSRTVCEKTARFLRTGEFEKTGSARKR